MMCTQAGDSEGRVFGKQPRVIADLYGEAASSIEVRTCTRAGQKLVLQIEVRSVCAFHSLVCFASVQQFSQILVSPSFSALRLCALTT